MKPKFYMLCLVAILLGTLAMVTSAQENNPLVNEDANACFEGGAFYGMCDKIDVDDDGDADAFDSEWCWNCGWYYIRVQYNIFSPDVLEGICRAVPPVPVIVEEEDDEKDKDNDDDDNEEEDDDDDNEFDEDETSELN